MEHYVIITRNMNLIKCSMDRNALTYEALNTKLMKNLKTDVLISTPDKRFAYLALFEGSQVYETFTHKSLVPACKTREKLIDCLTEIFLETLGFEKLDRGYYYLKYMIKKHVEDAHYSLQPMGEVVYPECAAEFGVSPKTISRYANLTLRNCFKRNMEQHIAVWGDMAGKNALEVPKVAHFTIYAGEKIRSILPKE